MFNEGLEQLGTGECDDDGYECQGLFQGSAIESVTLPTTLRRIAQSAFYGCWNLKTIKLPALLEAIGENCFLGSGIVSIEIPPHVEEVKDSAFCNCGALHKVSFPKDSRLHTIGAFAFAYSGLKEFVAPASLRQIGRGAFWNCRALRQAKLNDGLVVLGINVLDKDKSSEKGAFEDSALEQVSLPATLERIQFRAFAKCDKLVKITLPPGL